MDDEIRGNTPDVILMDAMVQLTKTLDKQPVRVIMIAHSDQTGFIEFCKNAGLDVITRVELSPPKQEVLDNIEHVARYSAKTCMAEALLSYCIEPCAYEIPHEVHHDPAPKKIPIKQARVRQSFRQSMRSVNRNR